MSARNDKLTTLAGPGTRAGSLLREEVDDFQRVRIISAMMEVTSELGYIGAAVAPVVARAGVSRRTFYELFDGREDCFLAAFEWGVRQMREVIIDGGKDSQPPWRQRVRSSLAALLLLLDSEPALARTCVIEALGAGKPVLERRAMYLEELIAALDAGAPRSRDATGAPLLTAEGVVGGAFSVIHGRLLERDSDREGDVRVQPDRESSPPGDGSSGRAPAALIDLHGQLMALIAFPYLGPRVAGEELTRPAPEMPRRLEVGRARSEGGRLLERLDMRLTYRTVRCLLFIGEHPGVSNREIAKGAEIPDEGQASKLLGRLVKLDLIVNGTQHGPGLPNRWMLTSHGEQVLGAVKGR